MQLPTWTIWLTAYLLANPQLATAAPADKNAATVARAPAPVSAPRIALKLTPEAQEKQKKNAEFIDTLLTAVDGTLQKRKIKKTGVKPLIPLSERPSESLQRLRTRDADVPNFDAWYQFEIDDSTTTVSIASSSSKDKKLSLSPSTLELIHKLNALDAVESVQALQEGPPPAVSPNDDPRNTNQGYLNAAPQGINARYAWTINGGDGFSANIVDVEQGWNLNHEDLVAQNITLISGRNAAYPDHGTSVLGEVLMRDNNLGGVGIVPRAKGRVISQHRSDGSYNTAAAILDACNRMVLGDILLLEAQEFDPVGGQYYWPVSVADANYDAIRACTNLGITVVEAACNGGYDLDVYRNAANKRIFNRNFPSEYRESGAVMVGAASSATPHVRLWYSNQGTRVDVYAWGENIDTTSTDSAGTANNLYTTGFSGTSGASPIVVGAAAAIQGIAQVRLGRKIPPARLRTILRTSGTASQNPSTDRIGVLPNLKAIIDGGHIRL
ncbi:peptidase S8/S53 domain-containing protein [Podospora australis]|uniref:Peptidase S8/S53 domain-containing protein n=1 Tax=Podospora australis TaxID=1536484 RepID=A0AAN7AG45_9PEZI|nr:peptidase S8/S53 domain-containing protein [Podospora australis]